MIARVHAANFTNLREFPSNMSFYFGRFAVFYFFKDVNLR